MILYERTKMSAEVEMFNAPSKTQPSTRSQRRGESVLQNQSVAAQGGGASALLVRGSREWPMRIDGRDRQVQRSRRAIRQPARLQENAIGGLKPSTRRLLERWGRNVSERSPSAEPVRTRLKAGTVLVREWHGITHRLTVLDDGFDFDGERFRSLSEIA